MSVYVAGWTYTGMAMTDEHLSRAQLLAIAVARRFGDAMRPYLAEQTQVLHDHAVVEDSVTCIGLSFREAMQVEEELIALFDAVEGHQGHDRSGIPTEVPSRYRGG
jgi:hypothetical protein